MVKWRLLPETTCVWMIRTCHLVIAKCDVRIDEASILIWHFNQSAKQTLNLERKMRIDSIDSVFDITIANDDRREWERKRTGEKGEKKQIDLCGLIRTDRTWIVWQCGEFLVRRHVWLTLIEMEDGRMQHATQVKQSDVNACPPIVSAWIAILWFVFRLHFGPSWRCWYNSFVHLKRKDCATEQLDNFQCRSFIASIESMIAANSWDSQARIQTHEIQTNDGIRFNVFE